MKITIEDNVKQFILYRINKVYIGFDDNTEVKLDRIIDQDIDLDSIDCSTIGFTNAFQDVEIENHFKGNKKNHVIYVHIEATGVNPISDCMFNVFYDIPCDMKIRRLRNDGGYSECSNMFIELEGLVK